MDQKFSEMSKVRVICEHYGKFEGYVIGALWRGERWIYKISLAENGASEDTFDNWIPEECLEKYR